MRHLGAGSSVQAVGIYATRAAAATVDVGIGRTEPRRRASRDSRRAAVSGTEPQHLDGIAGDGLRLAAA